MRLKVVLPHQILLEQNDVLRIVVETRQGSLGLLPRRLDCAAPLSPGILIYETKQGEKYLAVGAGLLTKVGPNVSVAVSNAVHSDNLQTLRQIFASQFIKQDKHEKEFRTALTRLESAFVRHFLELKRYG